MCADTDRVTVTVYVREYQKEEWTDHADRLDMGLSEFVRSMVQAGRVAVTDADGGEWATPDEAEAGTADEAEVATPEEAEATSPDDGPRSPDSTATTNGENPERIDPTGAFREQLLATLDATEWRTWEEIKEDTIGDIEANLEAELQELLAEDRVTHAPRNGGYRLVE